MDLIWYKATSCFFGEVSFAHKGYERRRYQPAAHEYETQQNEEPNLSQPPEWNSPATREESRAFRQKALAYLEYKQKEA